LATELSFPGQVLPLQKLMQSGVLDFDL